ncbi:MAG: HEAT repeat domain-containing protein [Planctomycetota bacterium]
MPDALEARLAKLGQLTELPDPHDAVAPLRDALKLKTNLIVARAADVAADLELHALNPDLIAALARWLDTLADKDRRCWAKAGLAHALATNRAAGDDAEAVYRRAITLQQWDPVWGKTEDSAGPVRAAAALGLVRAGSRHSLLALADLLHDHLLPVRLAATEALGELGGEPALALLRLRALTDTEPEAVAACCGVLLGIDRSDHFDTVPFVTDQLKAANDELAERLAFAIAESRHDQTLPLLRLYYHRTANTDAHHAHHLAATALAVARREDTLNFLLDRAADPEIDPTHIIRALAIHKHNPALREQLESAIATRPDANQYTDTLADALTS